MDHRLRGLSGVCKMVYRQFGKAWMRFGNKIVIAVAIGLLAPAGVGALSYWNAVREEKERVWIDHAQVVLDRIYALTEDDVYLISYRRSAGDISSALAELRRLTGDNPGQQRTLGVLEPLVLKKTAIMQAALQTRKDQG